MWNWIERIRNEDSGWVHFLKWCYSVGKKSWVHAIVTSACGICIPILYEKEQTAWMIVTALLLVLDTIFASICTEYQKRQYTIQKCISELFDELGALLKSLDIYVQRESQWKKSIFKTTSGMVCNKIYTVFKSVFDCETRVSVEHVFSNPRSGSETYVEMAGRKSKHRSEGRNSVPLTNRNKYFSYSIFSSNNKGLNILGPEDIQNDQTWYKNPANNTDVKQYIGIAVSAFDNQAVNFILQIDILDDFKFGKNNSPEEIQQFVDNYLLPYVNVVALAYLLNLNKSKVFVEV